MALPLALALAAVHATEDLARGEAEFLRGNVHCDSREFADALACYDRAATFGYEDQVMWNNRGVALDGLGRHEDAILAYTRALQRSSTYEIAAYNLGNAYAQLAQFEEALVAYDRALAIRRSTPTRCTTRRWSSRDSDAARPPSRHTRTWSVRTRRTQSRGREKDSSSRK